MTPEELNYYEDDYGYFKYGANDQIIFEIFKSCVGNHEWKGHIHCLCMFYKQSDIDNLQIAYNNLQRDLKELNNENNVTR